MATRLSVISDGTPNGTLAFDDKGEMIEGVSSVTWTCKAGETPRVLIEFLASKIDIKLINVNVSVPEKGSNLCKL